MGGVPFVAMGGRKTSKWNNVTGAGNAVEDLGGSEAIGTSYSQTDGFETGSLNGAIRQVPYIPARVGDMGYEWKE